jgi:hypothetical protein
MVPRQDVARQNVAAIISASKCRATKCRRAKLPLRQNVARSKMSPIYNIVPIGIGVHFAMSG